MKVITLLKKLFGENNVVDYMDTLDNDEESMEIEYWAIDENEGDSEPSYFVKLFANGLYTVRSINGDTLLSTSDTKELKVFLKTLK